MKGERLKQQIAQHPTWRTWHGMAWYGELSPPAQGPVRDDQKWYGLIRTWIHSYKYHMKVFPAMGLTKRPFRAAFISAYNAGLIPFFLHFFISASVRLLVSKLLDFQSLLDTES